MILDSRILPLSRELDIYLARSQARQVAAALNFSPYSCTEIETAVSEICSNALHYGGRGWVTLRGGPEGFEIVCIDEGPGFAGGGAPPRPDGLGIGLRGAAQLLDELRLEGSPGGGGKVVGRKRIDHGRSTANRAATTGGDWVVACAQRPAPAETENGDVFFVSRWTGAGGDASALLVGVIDGLGHGPEAARTAATVAAHFTGRAGPAGRAARDPGGGPSLATLLSEAHTIAVATRGAAATLVYIEPAKGRILHAGVGNVQGLVLPEGEPLVPAPGCLGVHLPPIHITEAPWDCGSAVLLWTDGLSGPPVVSRPGPDGEPSTRAGWNAWRPWLEATLHRLADPRDDALLLAAFQLAS